jgi:glycosyltransferase involved in cell wall biosynthesis
MRLDLGAANAIQTYSTVRELQRVMPGVRLVVPRWLREPSAFEELGALHLPRPAANKLSKFLPWAGWSYLERTVYAFMLLALLLVWRLTGRRYPTLYVRDAVCAAWLCALRHLHGSRVIYEVHDLEASHPSKASRWPRAFWRRFLPWLDRVALTRSEGLVSLTEAFKGWAASKGLRHPERVTVIPDAYDPEVYFPSDPRSARAELGLPQGVPIVGYTGLTFAYRGLDLLVEAFAQVRHRHPGALLVLVGGRTHEIAELKELARWCGIPDEKVLFPGQVSQPVSARYLNASDVLVIPDTVTTMTASPLKLFEYMAVGKPIVCKDMPALREILDDDSAAFFESGSVEALAAALTSMLDDPEAARRLGATALQRSAQYTYLGRAQKIVKIVMVVRS